MMRCRSADICQHGKKLDAGQTHAWPPPKPAHNRQIQLLTKRIEELEQAARREI